MNLALSVSEPQVLECGSLLPLSSPPNVWHGFDVDATSTSEGRERERERTRALQDAAVPLPNPCYSVKSVSSSFPSTAQNSSSSVRGRDSFGNRTRSNPSAASYVTPSNAT